MLRIEKLRYGKYFLWNEEKFCGQWDGELSFVQKLVDLHNDWERLNEARSGKLSPVASVTETYIEAVGKPTLFEDRLQALENYGNEPLAVEPERCETTREEL